MSCPNRNLVLRLESDNEKNTLSGLLTIVIVPIFCACMIAARGEFSGIHTGILKMLYQMKTDTEFIAVVYLKLYLFQFQCEPEIYCI